MKKQYEKYVIAMKQIGEKYKYDEEACHSRADDLLCEFLKQLGYRELVEEYEKLPKWYA